MSTPEEQFVPAVHIWWSRPHKSFIASAPAASQDIIGVGKTFPEAAINLEKALKDWSVQQPGPPPEEIIVE